MAFASRGFPDAGAEDDSPAHTLFVRAWREATLLHLTTIAEGDVDLAVLAAQHARKVFHNRIWTPRIRAMKGKTS